MDKDTKNCPYCGEIININAKKCKYCKTWIVKQEEEYIRCPFCQEPVLADAEKCPHCGEWLVDESNENSCGCGFANPMVNGIAILSLIILIIGFFIAIFGGGFETFFIALAIAIAFCFGMYIYFLPTIIAISRNHPQRLAIFLINLFFGETVIGWVGSMVWAVMHRQGRHTHW